MTNLSAKQQALLNAIKTETIVEVINPNEFSTALALERKGLITLNCIQTGDRKFYEATLVDPRREVVKTIQGFMAQLQAACQALEGEPDPTILLNHMGYVKDNGRIETLRRAIQEQALVLFEEQRNR